MQKKSVLFIFSSISLIICFFLLFSGCGDSSVSPGTNVLDTSYSPESWMKDCSSYIEYRKLNEIAIPGTHDSGTCNINSGSAIADDGNENPVITWIDKVEKEHDDVVVKDFLNWVRGKAAELQAGWSRSQYYGIGDQLTRGIRYFDLRIEYVPSSGENWIVHSMRSMKVDEALSDIRNFYNNTANTDREIIILDINHLYQFKTSADHEQFINKIKTQLVDNSGNSLLIPRGSSLAIHDIWNTKQRIILFYSDQTTVDSHNELWYHCSDDIASTNTSIVSPWPDTMNISTLQDFMANTLNNRGISDFQQNGGFFVTQAIRTPGSDDIYAGIETYCWKNYNAVDILLGWLWKDEGWAKDAPQTLQEVASATNAYMGQNIEGNIGSFKDLVFSRLNIMIVNFFDTYPYGGGYLQLIVDANKSILLYEGSLNNVSPSYSPVPIHAGQTKELSMTFRNNGNIAWDPNTVFLGTSNPHDRNSHLYTTDGWISISRIKMQNTSPVQTGETATFKFSITPDSEFQTSEQQFALVADKSYNGTPAQWFGGNAFGTFNIKLNQSPYQSYLVGQNPSATVVLHPQQSVQLELVFKNDGTTPWDPNVVLLGTSNPHDRDSHLSTSDGWISKTRIKMQNTSLVQPGENAIFTFSIMKDSSIVPDITMEQQFELVTDKEYNGIPAQWFGEPAVGIFKIMLI